MNSFACVLAVITVTCIPFFHLHAPAVPGSAAVPWYTRSMNTLSFLSCRVAVVWGRSITHELFWMTMYSKQKRERKKKEKKRQAVKVGLVSSLPHELWRNIVNSGASNRRGDQWAWIKHRGLAVPANWPHYSRPSRTRCRRRGPPSWMCQYFLRKEIFLGIKLGKSECTCYIFFEGFINLGGM